MNNNIIVLYVGDDPHVKDILSNFSFKPGWEVRSLANVQRLVDQPGPHADICLFDLDHHLDDADEIAAFAGAKGLPLIFLASTIEEELYYRYRKTLPAGFLIKPFHNLQLRCMIETWILCMGPDQKSEGIWQSWCDEERQQESFFVKNNNKLVKVRQLDILAVMADGNYCVIVTPQRRHAVKISLRRMMLKLSPLFFKQIHRNYIIQLPKVESVDLSTGEVILGGETYPIGGSFRQRFLDDLDRI